MSLMAVIKDLVRPAVRALSFIFDSSCSSSQTLHLSSPGMTSESSLHRPLDHLPHLPCMGVFTIHVIFSSSASTFAEPRAAPQMICRLAPSPLRSVSDARCPPSPLLSQILHPAACEQHAGFLLLFFLRVTHQGLERDLGFHPRGFTYALTLWPQGRPKSSWKCHRGARKPLLCFSATCRRLLDPKHKETLLRRSPQPSRRVLFHFQHLFFAGLLHPLTPSSTHAAEADTITPLVVAVRFFWLRFRRPAKSPGFHFADRVHSRITLPL